MKLTLEQIKEVATGAVRFVEDEEGIKLFRFTEEQEKMYKEVNEDFWHRSLATSGIKFAFKTNSENLFIKTKIIPRYSRRYFSFDVFVNGEPIGYLDNFADAENIEEYIKIKLLKEEFEKDFELGDGDKTVCVILPWALQAVIEEISLDDGSYIEPVKRKKTLLAYGDSITQGYDAFRSANRYIARLAEVLEADEINKGIGGECFCPWLAEMEKDLNPDYVTVAYGTNDWSKKGKEIFDVNSRAFYETVSKKYPSAKIFAITPIWRADLGEYREFGKFEDVEKGIKEAVEGLENVTVISGYDFVPHDLSYFADARLHPNDKGFDCYSNCLIEEVKKYI